MNTPPILPADAYLASMLGITTEEYRWFKQEAYKRSKIEPGTPVAGLETLLILSLVFTLISIGLAIAASFFKPKPQQPGQINQEEQDPDNVTRSQKFAPRYGFDSVQKPATIGTTIPVVYSDRRDYSASSNPPRPAGLYGGIRVNLPLLWSQMWSLGGDQFLRAVFLIGEGEVRRIENLAIGDNLLNGYDLMLASAMEQAAKLTIYFKPNGGRIVNTDYFWGRLPSSDPGNMMLNGAPDIFTIQSSPDFSFTSKPSVTTKFGLYGWCPNNVAYRANPRLGPTINIERRSIDEGKRFQIDAADDAYRLAETWKYKYQFSRRCAIVSATGTYNPGDSFAYVIYKETDASTEFRFNSSNTSYNDENNLGISKCQDVASAVASAQHTADSNLIVGELYKFGSLLAVLISRSPDDVFISDGDNYPVGNGRSITYYFKVVKSGYIEAGQNVNPGWSGTQIFPPYWDYINGEYLSNKPIPTAWPVVSETSQGFRCAIGQVRLTRPTSKFEIGIRSTVGIKIQGICNFKDADNVRKMNDEAGGKWHNQKFDMNKSLGIMNMQTGVMTMPETRYSFFQIYYRKATEEDYTLVNGLFCVADMSAQPIYNFMRFSMPTVDTWEIRFEPVSSFQIRKNVGINSTVCVLDAKSGDPQATLGVVGTKGTITSINALASSLSLSVLKGVDNMGIGWSDTNGSHMVDSWGRVAEAFCYDEIQTTCSEGPEHEIVYVNTYTSNTSAPQYDNLALVGLNIKAGAEWSQLAQLSAYVPKGRVVDRYIQGDQGPSNIFPDILRDLLLSTTFGVGNSISSAQIDHDSFEEAAYWCRDRRYFFDGLMADKINLRQWAADTAATMLLDLLLRDGRFALQPALRFTSDGPVPIRALFTAGNIVENSFSMEFLAEEDRQEVQVSVKWREERVRSNYVTSGSFPVEREVLVREASASEDAPVESFDIANYCTNLEHAIDFACYVIRMRRMITHSIKFSTTPEGLDAGIRAGDYIKVALDFTYYDEFANGVILEDGTIVSTRPDLLTQGAHQIVYWDGSSGPVTEGVMLIDADGKATPTKVMFVKKSVTTQIRVYKIESISLGENGQIDIEAVHHPVDANDYSELAKNWTTYRTDSNWVISVA